MRHGYKVVILHAIIDIAKVTDLKLLIVLMEDLLIYTRSGGGGGALGLSQLTL